MQWPLDQWRELDIEQANADVGLLRVAETKVAALHAPCTAHWFG